MIMNRTTIRLICYLSASWIAHVSFSTTFYVSPSGSHHAPYDTPGKAATNIQSAVNIATNTGDIVMVLDGTYLVTTPVSVMSAITILSENGPNSTIVNGSGTTHCFELADVNCIVSGLTITNGYNSGNGGGIACANSIVPIITNCVISGNTSTSSGGGVFGGTIFHSTIRDNVAASQGGGIYSAPSPTPVYDSLIVGNVVSNDYGGGVENGILYNCTVVGNTAPDAGGADTCTIYNSIIYSNTALVNGDVAYSALDSSCVEMVGDGVSGNYITLYPKFSDFSAGDYRLQADSPCIDTGNTNSYTLNATDLDGNSRIRGFLVDIGAYEFQLVTPFPISGQWTDNGFVVEWPLAYMYDCQVYWTTNLTNGFSPVGPIIYHPQNSYTDTINSANPSGFYKVEAQ